MGALEANLESFAVGDSDSDKEEDLLDLDPESSPKASISTAQTFLDSENKPYSPPKRTTSMPRPTHSANLALDPTRPLHITLPTFRMVVLADELLQQFFESSFPSSFQLSAHPILAPSTPLTTFTSPLSPTSMPPTGPRAGGIVPPSKGLRGVLDNIVQDGMRVATEVRKRVDDVGRELERTATQRESEMDEEDHDTGAYGGESDRKSVRERDRDLLEGAEAEVEGTVGGPKPKQDEDLLGDLDGITDGGGGHAHAPEQKGLVEFER